MGKISQEDKGKKLKINEISKIDMYFNLTHNIMYYNIFKLFYNI